MAAPSLFCLSSPFSLNLHPSVPPATLFSSIHLPMRRSQLSAVSVRAADSAKPMPAPRQPKGIMKPKPITPELQAIVGVSEIPRTQALKLIWAYIKERELQDPNDKKIIVCDEKLRKVFGKDRVGFLEVSKLLNPHFAK